MSKRGFRINAREGDVKGLIYEMSHGKGADFVIEAAATQSAFDQAFDIVKASGTVVTIGTFDKPVSFNPFFEMTRREIRLISIIGRTSETWRRMVQLIDGGHIVEQMRKKQRTVSSNVDGVLLEINVFVHPVFVK